MSRKLADVAIQIEKINSEISALNLFLFFVVFKLGIQTCVIIKLSLYETLGNESLCIFLGSFSEVGLR